MSVFNDIRLQFHKDPHHKSNWCVQCGLYYCWHPECERHRNDSRAMHKFVPNIEENRLPGGTGEGR